MQSSDRLHALDAVRAFALLSGIALHAAQPFLAGLPWVTVESPSNVLAAVWYTIHMFRMPLFFLIAGFFARMTLERRGLAGFVKDRLRRILVPLVVGLPIVMLLTGVALVLGTLATGADPRSLQAVRPPPSADHHDLFPTINLIHLWFLYYLLIFYAGALIVRSACTSMPAPIARLQGAVDAAVRFAMRGIWGPLLLALPVATYFYQLQSWAIWGGLPAPFSLVPDFGALIGYGLFFGFGWLLHRQEHLLRSLEGRWLFYGVLAIALWAVCRIIGGATPHWEPHARNTELVVYTVSYIMAAWCWSFGLIGVSIRYLSGYSSLRRYLADSSYWLYLMHIPALFFFGQILHPLPWHWSLKYPLSITGAMSLLLLSYHYLVRFTIVGATLNGRRHPRLKRELPQATTVG